MSSMEGGHCQSGDFFCEYFAIPALVIVFRETLEATVLLAVLLQYLKRAGQEHLSKQVWQGAAAGCAGTLVFGAIILTVFYSGLGLMPPRAAYIVEGILLGAASIELTYFFVTHLAPGMKSDRQWKAKWEGKMDEMMQKVIESGENKKFFKLTATTVFREGFEAVVFITPFAAAYKPVALLIPSLTGLFTGIGLGILSFVGSNKMDLTVFFIMASVFFLFMSAGLASHASYEFQKAEVFGTWYCPPKNLCDDAIELIEAEEEAGDGYRRRFLADVVLGAMAMGGTADRRLLSNVANVANVSSFEAGWDSWSTGNGGKNFNRISGATPTGDTGPSVAYVGSYYAYCETSAPNDKGKTFTLDRDFGESVSVVSFAYHMYGATTGTAELQGSEDGGSTYTTLWSKDGDQGDVWHAADVSIGEDYPHWLKFVYTSDSGFEGDFGLDEVEVEMAAPTSAPTASPAPTMSSAPTTSEPTTAPSELPIPSPTPLPTVSTPPSPLPVPAPSRMPIPKPTPAPTISSKPSAEPTTLYDDDCVTYEQADDAFAYRRLGGDDEDLFSRSRSCDEYKNREVAWNNVEVWDITPCCDVKTSCNNPPCKPEGKNMFFFILMILFWYRPQMTRLELIVMCLYWPITLYWGFGKVKSIKGFNASLSRRSVAPEPLDDEEAGKAQDEKGLQKGGEVGVEMMIEGEAKDGDKVVPLATEPVISDPVVPMDDGKELLAGGTDETKENGA